MKAHTNKVVCYVVVRGHLLVITHADLPLEEVGVQVPAGTIQPGEEPTAAALREATEETGLAGLRVVRELGQDEYDISPYRDEVMHRHFVELTADTDIDATWTWREQNPTGGGEGPLFRCSWIPLERAHVLAGGQSVKIGALV